MFLEERTAFRRYAIVPNTNPYSAFLKNLDSCGIFQALMALDITDLWSSKIQIIT